VNNAAITRDGLAMRMKAEDWDAVIPNEFDRRTSVHPTGLATMIARARGKNHKYCLRRGAMGNAGQSNLCCGEGGLIGLTKAIAIEISSRNITVNAVAPGLLKRP